MWRRTTILLAVAVGVGVWVGCATTGTTSTTTTAEPEATAAKAAAAPAETATAAAERVKVARDGRVDREEVTVSISRNDTVEWDSDAGTTLQIVPDEAESQWPLDLRCNANHCDGTLRASARIGRHPYHATVDEKAGSDPVIIIEG